MGHQKFLLTILFAICIHREVAASKSDSNYSDDNQQEQHACGIYLAESTIPGAGLGMFAGNRDYKKGEALTSGDLFVPMFELDWHNEGRDYDFLWDEYTWAHSTFNDIEEEIDDPEQICVASFGMGAAVNCMLPLVNVREASSAQDYFTEKSYLSHFGLNSTSAGVGAFTPYNNGRPTKARRDIRAGEELYVSYGEQYFTSRDGYDFVPLRKHYKQADKLTKRFQILTIRLPHSSPSLEEDLWKVVKDSAISNFNSRLQNALYDTWEKALQSLNNGGAAIRHYNASKRNIDWLEEHGVCMDNIESRISTIQDAGRGAFARRFIGKGEVITATPLIHLPQRIALTMYDGKLIIDPYDTSEHILVKDDEKPSHQQLILNYCFGHRDSTLLLCPYGYLSPLINHSHKEPNARIEWSQKKSLTAHPEWFNQSIKEWGSKNHAGLSFNYVALRDIEESEEILIDYGEEWEAAWQKHSNNFKSPRPDFIPAFELNQMADLKVKTVSEYDYVSNGVSVFCRRYYVLQFDSNIELFQEWEGYEDKFNERLAIYPCRVVERHHDDSYDVELIAKDYAKVDDTFIFPHHKVVSHILLDVPRDIFFFRDQPNHRDHHQTWSFRHDMRIPDDIFPEAWKNRLDPQETKKEEAKTETDLSDECWEDGLTCAEL